jgi:hypothetical protein
VSKRRRTGTASISTPLTEKSAQNPELAVDAGRMGSVARFLNHCCEPNLFVQSVFIEYSCRVHRIALFAARDILPYEGAPGHQGARGVAARERYAMHLLTCAMGCLQS